VVRASCDCALCLGRRRNVEAGSSGGRLPRTAQRVPVCAEGERNLKRGARSEAERVWVVQKSASRSDDVDRAGRDEFARGATVRRLLRCDTAVAGEDGCAREDAQTSPKDAQTGDASEATTEPKAAQADAAVDDSVIPVSAPERSAAVGVERAVTPLHSSNTIEIL